MTLDAATRCLLVDGHVSSASLLTRCVAQGTVNRFVPRLQRIGRIGLMIECGWFPPPHLMTPGTISGAHPVKKLPVVNILVASGTAQRGGVERDIFQARFEVLRFVTLLARKCAMCARKNE